MLSAAFMGNIMGSHFYQNKQIVRYREYTVVNDHDILRAHCTWLDVNSIIYTPGKTLHVRNRYDLNTKPQNHILFAAFRS